MEGVVKHHTPWLINRSTMQLKCMFFLHFLSFRPPSAPLTQRLGMQITSIIPVIRKTVLLVIHLVKQLLSEFCPPLSLILEFQVFVSVRNMMILLFLFKKIASHIVCRPKTMTRKPLNPNPNAWDKAPDLGYRIALAVRFIHSLLTTNPCC